MKTFRCTACDGTITVGHPAAVFRRRAVSLARDTHSFLARLFRRRRILQRLLRSMEERYYLEPDRFRDLPPKCPRCGHRGQGDLPWWRAGLAFDE